MPGQKYTREYTYLMHRRGNGIRMESNSTRYYPCDDGKRRCQCLNQSISFIDHQRPPCSVTMQSTFEAGDARIAMAQCLRCQEINWVIYEWTCAIRMLNSAISNRAIMCSRTRRRTNHSTLLRIGFRNDRHSRKAGRAIYGDVNSASSIMDIVSK